MGKKKANAKKNKNQGQQSKQLPEISPEVRGGILFCLSIVMLLSLASFASGKISDHWLGLAGFTVGWVLTGAFGLSSYVVAGYLAWTGWATMIQKPVERPHIKHLILGTLVFSLSMLLTLIEVEFPDMADAVGSAFFSQMWERKYRFHLGGAPFYYLYNDMPVFSLSRLLNAVGVGILFGATFLASLLLLLKISPGRILAACAALRSLIPDKGFFWKKTGPEQTPSANEDMLRYVKLKIPNLASTSPMQPKEPSGDAELLAIQPERNLTVRPSLSGKKRKDIGIAEPFEGLQGKAKRREFLESHTVEVMAKTDPAKSKREVALAAQRVHNGDFTEYKQPGFTLLSNPKKVDQSTLKKDLRKQAEVLEETLHSFGIEAKVGQINCGPTITSFEVHPAIGVKVQKIKALENDIALNMEAKSIRILAPIPGKAAIGIEVPNAQPQEVAFKDILNAYLQGGKKFHIPILLGKTVNGEYVMEDLAKMPHLIIAGATGSGKSVCINTIVMSILMTAKPDQIKLIMVDPKKVELTPYTKLPHMLAPVITEPKGACAAMQWLVKEMENRYEILKAVGFRNIEAYNNRSVNKDFEETLDREIPEKMHYILCIIDELADLMMIAGNDIETYIARLAQMARAVGIHLLLATQRPSREVITGLIKANFPTRISFKVSSRINSQIVLDEIGAESLLGNGDLLFLPPGAHHLVRAQGAYIRDEDINKVVEHICSQAPPNYQIASFDDMDTDEAMPDAPSGPKDSLFEQARDLVVTTGNASTTYLQRKLKVGYARAASLMDQLEAHGVIGPAHGAKPREVIRKNTDDDE